MQRRRTMWAGVALCTVWLTAAEPVALPAPLGAAPLPLDAVAELTRARVQAVFDKPTLRSRGPIESFTCQPAIYDWLLDHPDLAVRLWRLLGAKCADILPEGGDRFLWKDGQSNVRWDTVLKQPGLRIWYAEGEVRPGLLLPSVPVKAVAVLRYSEGKDSAGRVALRHQVELTLHTDSHAVALVTRMLGASAPRVAEQYVGQIEVFYAALAWYLDQHPRHAEALFAQLRRPSATDAVAKPAPRRTPPAANASGDS